MAKEAHLEGVAMAARQRTEGWRRGPGWNKPKRAQLTDAFVESLPKPPEGKKDYWMRDTRIAGFSVRVYAPDEHGAIPKIFGFTIAIDGREKYFQIGRFGIMTAARARKEAQQIDENVRNKRDPYAHRQDVSLVTVNELFEEWKQKHWPTGLAQSTQERYQRLWDRFVPRSFKYLQLSQVDLGHIQDIQEKVTKGGIKYSRRRKVNFVEAHSAPSSVQANRVITMLSGMFKYQLKKKPEKRQGLDHNPCKAVTLDQENEIFVYLGREEQLRLRAFLESPESRCKPYSRKADQFAGTALDAINLIFHTGLRHREALNLEWTSVDFDLGTIGCKVTKYGAKRPRVKQTKHIHMTSPARTLLLRLYKAAGGPSTGWVFPGPLNPEKPWSNIQGTWEAIRDLLQLPEETRLHDLRHTMATDLLRSGMERGEVQLYMGWKSIDSANRYMHVVSKQTHLKAEVIIATRGIGAAGQEGGVPTKPIRSKATPQVPGMLQEAVDRARDLLIGFLAHGAVYPRTIQEGLQGLAAAFNPKTEGKGAGAPAEQFAVVSKAAELMGAISDEGHGTTLAALPKELVGSITALRSHLELLGVLVG